MRSPRARVLAALTAVAAFAVPAGEAVAADNGRPVKVMTRNLYLGGNIFGPATAVGSLTGFPALLAFGNANHALFNVVGQTNFPERAKLLAAEIDQNEPDLIGLQEVALWRTGPIQIPPAAPNATTVYQDFLQILMDEIAATGENYRVVNVTREADVEGPAFPGMNIPAGQDVRLTMRDVILRRVEGNIKVLDEGTGNYGGHPDSQFSLSVAGLPFTFTRGYGWADVVVKKRRFRFINTHLESAFSDNAYQQATELLAGPADTNQPVVIVCDCNSDPLNHTTKPTDVVDHAAPYELITQSFADEWLLVRPASEGWTSGFNEFVNDADTSGIDHRIDMVFGRRADGSAIPADRATVVGNTVRTADGRWPSDHLGVVVRLKP